jgi:hypothetical protein
MILKKLILPLLAASMFGATQSGGLAVQESITNAPASVKKDSVNGIYYSLHIVWEGLEVEDYHIKKLEKFRGEHPDISVIHHVSPLYATSAMSRYDLKKNLEKVFRKGDQMGVYISGWKSVVEEAGVKFRSENSFWGNKLREDCTVCGSEIPITSYTKSELEKISDLVLPILHLLRAGKVAPKFLEYCQITE